MPTAVSFRMLNILRLGLLLVFCRSNQPRLNGAFQVFVSEDMAEVKSTMTQQSVNRIAVLHTHQDELDALDTAKILSEFLNASDIRGSIF